MLTDIYQKIERDFADKTPLAIAALDQLDAKTKGLVSPRLIRSIVYLAKGDVSELEKYISLAQVDWRDVLLQAEYSYPDNTRLRDFDKTFHELKLLSKTEGLKTK